ncbi:hypothetical protein RIF29_14352 [Crotalaria pallida]|uniref:Uncharacterized protein n=1 Tax=Crotalaria pallida TaxID=3830 RepID=A0AAN9FJX6_CROPI
MRSEQTLREKHDKPSTEEDDQKNRSNKKIKPNEEHSGNEIEMEDQHVQGADNMNQLTPPKPSYCEVAMSMEGYKPNAMGAKPDAAMQVASPPPEKVAQSVAENSAGILLSGPEKDGEKIPKERTTRTNVGGEYGPWMLVQRPQRRNMRNRRDEKEPKNKGKESNRFHVLEQEMHETVEKNNARDQRVMNYDHQTRKSHKQQKGNSASLVKPKPKQAQSQQPQVGPKQKYLPPQIGPQQMSEQMIQDPPHTEQVAIAMAETAMERVNREAHILKMISNGINNENPCSRD